MGTTEIGALIVSLRTESAAFSAEMDKARTKMKGAGDTAVASSRQIAKLAADGFGAVLPISFQVENAIERFIERTLKAQGALAVLGKGLLAVGVGFAAFKIGSFIGEFLALGTTIEKYEKNVKAATDEQRKFSDAMSAARGTMRSLAEELVKLRGDEERVLALQFEGRAEQIIKQFGGASPVARAALAELAKVRAEAERKLLEDRRKAGEEFLNTVLEQMKKERDEKIKTWQQETAAFSEQLKLRLKLRQDFEAQLGQGGFAGPSAAGGFAALRQLRERIQKEARDLAFLEREGLIDQTTAVAERARIRTQALDEARLIKEQFREFPTVLAAVDKAIASVQFGNFGVELAKARGEIDKLAPSLDSIREGIDEFAERLAAMPTFTDPASQAVRTLTRDFATLRAWVDATTDSLITLDRTIATTTE